MNGIGSESQLELHNGLRPIIDRLQQLLAAVDKIPGRSMTDHALRSLHDEIMGTLDKADRLDRPHLHECEELAGLRERLTLLNAELHLHTEVATAKDFLVRSRTADPFVDSFINKGFTSLLSGQIAHWRHCGVLDWSRQRIAVVGGGALPQTQHFLHRELGCPVVAIERDEEAAELCSAVLARLGTAGLSVVCDEGETHDYSSYTIVVLATLVRQKPAIAARILRTAPTAVFAPRTAVGNHQFWREPVDVAEMTVRGWELHGTWEPPNSSVASMVFRASRSCTA